MASQDYPYGHFVTKFLDAGIAIRVPIDSTPPNMYAVLTNAFPRIEGQLETRTGIAGLATISAGNPIHSIARLNENLLSNISIRLMGVGQSLFGLQDITGATVQTLLSGTLSGLPLSMAPFRFDADSSTWMIIGDRNNMTKVRSGTTLNGATVQALGIPIPTAAVTATAGAAGLLNSTGGIDYDWRITYWNALTQSEGSPSPVSQNAASDIKRPTASTNPDTGFGGVGFTNPNNAFDGNSATFAQGDATSAAASRQSCNWNTVTASGGTSKTDTPIFLLVDAETILTGGTNGGIIEFAIYFTLNNGTNWTSMMDVQSTAARKVYNATIPAGTLYSAIQVRAVIFGQGTVPGNDAQQDAGFTIRGGGTGGVGNFNNFTPTAGGNAVGQMKVYEITLSSTLATSGDLLLHLVNQQGNLCVPAPTDPQVTHIKVYRRGGSITAGWAPHPNPYDITTLVAGPCGAGMLQIIDNFADTSLTGSFLNIDNPPPVSSGTVLNQPLPYIWVAGDPPRVFGVGDPARPDAFYFSNPGNADQWPAENWLVLTDGAAQVMNGCSFGVSNFAFSKERMFEIVPNLVSGSGSGAPTFQKFATPCTRGLVAPQGLVSADRIYFVAKDGIYATTGGPEESLVENDIKPLFPTQDAPGQSVDGYDAVNINKPYDIHLIYHGTELWFIYRGLNTNKLQVLIYDTAAKKTRWRAASFLPNPDSNGLIDVVYSEPGVPSSLLLGGTDGVLYQSATGIDGANNIPVTILTGAFDMSQPLIPKEYGNVIFDIDTGGANPTFPVTITPLLNGGLQAQSALVISDGISGRRNIPMSLSDVYGFNIAFQITWTRTATINPTVYQLDCMYRLDAPKLTHWEAQPFNYGQGVFDCRKAYITLRSNGPVTLTITIDNNLANIHTYTIPSTSGARSKVVVPFQSNSGMLYRFSFDSTGTTQFQLYNNCIELQVKSRVKPLGYEIVRAFGLDAPAVTSQYESQALATGGQ